MKTQNTIRLRGTTADDVLNIAVSRMIAQVEAETSHTPTPWTSFYADPNSTVARIVEVWNNHEKIADVQGHNDDREADCANARHIVKCVNSHDRLVDALRAVGRSVCLDQRVSDKCICFSCEANRLLTEVGAA